VVSVRGSFRDGGYRSIRTYLTGTLNCSGAQANRIRRRADLVNRIRRRADALLSGHIGIDKIDRLATAATHPRAGDQFADFVPILLLQAKHLEYNDFDKVVDHFIDRADPDGAFDTQKFHEDHRTSNVRDDKGVVTVHADDQSLRTGGASRVRIRLRSTTRRPRRRRTAPDLPGMGDCARRWHSTPAARQHPVRSRLGRTRRLFTAKARAAPQLLVTTCTHRNCGIPATLCDVDHRREWAREDGPKDQAHAMPRCGFHDRWKHANKIRSRRSSSGRLFLIRPDRTTVLPVGAREPDWAEPLPSIDILWEQVGDTVDFDGPAITIRPDCSATA
jgi:hypothetical protein